MPHAFVHIPVTYHSPNDAQVVAKAGQQNMNITLGGDAMCLAFEGEGVGAGGQNHEAKAKETIQVADFVIF